MKDRKYIPILAFVLTSIAFCFLVIKDFSAPLTGLDDVAQYEYIGYFVDKNLSFAPLPQLTLVNNQVFYPYGTSSVFQPWGLERDIFFATLHSLFGSGPWLQIYYFLTVLVTVIGTFALLVQDYGFVRAAGAGLIASFFNFYAVSAYPHHLNLAVCHWTTLSFVTDFLIVKRVVLRQQVSLWLVLVRTWLLILSLSQDLGYIAGFALTSFTGSIIFIVTLLCYRYFTKKLSSTNFLQKTLATYKREFSSYSRISIFLLSLIIFSAYIYLPLIIQISTEAKSFELTGAIVGFSYWSNPLRLLIPFLPYFNPGLAFFEKFLLDNSGGEGSPGWFILILGCIGLWQARKQIAIFIPLLIIFVLCLLYEPFFFPTLKVFPWFALNRVTGRSTIIYPVILCLFAIHINFSRMRLRSRQLLCAFLVCIACLELFTFYSSKQSYQPYLPEKSFFAYMNYLKEQPGEAVLDWPFCIAGGNEMGDGVELCPFSNDEVYSFRRFHEKKVMGQYFGRLHPSQAKPYLLAGWEKLLDNSCFDSSEWSFFTDFYKFNDFAGINLYEDILPKGCASEFYARFGTPTIETVVPGSGRVKFIPKSPNLKNQVNLAAGMNLKLEPFLNLPKSNLLQADSPYGLIANGLVKIEQDQRGNNIRWGKEPETVLSFTLSQPQLLKLDFKLENSIINQEVVVEINQVSTETIFALQPEKSYERQVKFKGVTGVNDIIFKYRKEMTFADLFKDLTHLVKSKGIAGINYNNIKDITRRYRFRNAIKFTKLVISAAE